MSALAERLPGLQSRLDELVAHHPVPGATVAVLVGDEIIEAASGVLNLGTGVETTVGSIFQIGSITKVWTTTLIMQLVDQGLVDLDAPVVTYLPEFRLVDESAQGTVTVRHLLTHTSGIEGDHFDDFGRGSDAVERYVGSLADLGLVHPLGAMWSYCNSGFVVAGHIIARLTNRSYDSILRERLVRPLGLVDTVTLPEDAILRRAAVGHVSDPASGGLRPAPAWMLPPALGPAGSTITMPARELLAFAKMHIDDGRAADGTELLSPASVKAMQEVQVELPVRGAMGAAFGLGWAIGTVDGARLLGHNGGTIGQLAFLQVLPDLGIAVACLTNGPGGAGLYKALSRGLFADLAGITLPPDPVAADGIDIDLPALAGTYRRLNVVTEVAAAEGKLEASVRLQFAHREGPEAGQTIDLLPIDATTFLAVDRATGEPGGQWAFLDPDGTGRPAYLWASRVARRVD